MTIRNFLGNARLLKSAALVAGLGIYSVHGSCDMKDREASFLLGIKQMGYETAHSYNTMSDIAGPNTLETTAREKGFSVDQEPRFHGVFFR